MITINREATVAEGGPLGKYQDGAGHVFSLTAADAAKLGYALVAPVTIEPVEAKAIHSAPEDKAMRPEAAKS